MKVTTLFVRLQQETDIENYVILPATFNDCPRNNVQNFQDFFEIQRKNDKINLFVTFTIFIGIILWIT